MPNQPLSPLHSTLGSHAELNTPTHLSSQCDDSYNDLIDIDYLNEEQIKIDSSLKFLLNYSVNKRKPGRPKTGATSQPQPQPIPDTVNDQLKSITNVNDLHAGVLLDYLSKVNSLNRKILKYCNSLTEKYDALVDNVNTGGLRPSSSNPLTNDQTVGIEGRETQTGSLGIAGVENGNDDLQSKIDELEQRGYSDVVLVSGAFITSLSSGGDSSPKPQIIDALVSSTNNIVTRDDVVDVKLIGKNKSALKVVCKSSKIRNSLLSYARQQKPKDIYISEFLTQLRSKIFYEARLLRRQFSSKISSIYTRNGNIFYKLTGSDRYKAIRKLNDLTILKAKLNENNS